MDFLTRLPVVGPVVVRVLRSRPYRTHEHVGAVGGNRLAGAITFFGFLALFPLLTLAIAVTAALLSGRQVRELQQRIAEQIPGISGSLDLAALARNAATVGVISGVVLLVSGLGWVDTMRASIRIVWQVEEAPGNPFLRKLLDVGSLVGLGAVSALSLAASAVGTALAGRIAHAVGLRAEGFGGYVLAGVGFVVAVAADVILFAYLLGPFPRITRADRRAVVQGAVFGAVGFELLKLLLASYLSRVAGRNLYGAFGVPVALLLWINFVCRLLMYCVAWAALADGEAAGARARQRALEAYRAAGGKDLPETPGSPA